MADAIIDTNVLLVASAQDPSSLFKDSDHVPAAERQIVLEWLMAFRKDGQRKMVLDQALKIWDEYHKQMTRGQDIGSLVAAEKLQFARFIDIAFDSNGHGQLPAELMEIDPSDRKFVAVALKDLTDAGSSMIVNACDRGWYNCEEALKQAGVVVLQLIEDWSRREWKEKQKEKSKPVGHRSARARKKQPSPSVICVPFGVAWHFE